MELDGDEEREEEDGGRGWQEAVSFHYVTDI